MLTVNEAPYPFSENLRLGDVVRLLKPDADILIVNGMQASKETVLQDSDVCHLVKTGEIPSALDMEKNLQARHTVAHQKKLEQVTAGVMGLGGLGSAVAISLVKMGIGKLVICDYDVVVLSNIHRQHYFINQIGLKKTRALKHTLGNINPFVTVTTIDAKLNGDSIVEFFAGVDVLIECFDNAAMKAKALRTVLTRMPGTAYVGASGLAGFDSGNSIRSTKIKPGVYIVGDSVSDSATAGSLLAPRVGIAAHHQAHQALRLLLGLDD